MLLTQTDTQNILNKFGKLKQPDEAAAELKVFIKLLGSHDCWYATSDVVFAWNTRQQDYLTVQVSDVGTSGTP